MKKIIAVFSLIVGGLTLVQAQQDPMFTQYMFNEITVNPAYAGSHKVISATALYRNQWTGFDGAPITQSFNVHSPLKNERIGVGVSIINDVIGVSKNFNLYGNASYMIPFSAKSHLAFGLQAGFTRISEDISKLEINGGEAYTPDGGAEIATGALPNIGAGLHYETHNFYVGASVPKLLSTVTNDALGSLKQAQHYFLTMGYLINLNPLWMLKPATMIKAVSGAPINADISLDVIYDKTYSLGAAYRSGESLDLMGMYLINSEFRIGYSYDILLNALRNVNGVGGTHEIILNYRFSHDKSKVETPRFF